MDTIIAVIPHYHFKLLVQDFKSGTLFEFFDAMNSTGTDFNGYVAMRARLRYLNDRLVHTTNMKEINRSNLINYKPMIPSGDLPNPPPPH